MSITARRECEKEGRKREYIKQIPMCVFQRKKKSGKKKTEGERKFYPRGSVAV